MSGDQQHYLAQFLLRPFDSGASGRRPSVHVFHRERGLEARQSIKKIARERHMYGPSDCDLDKAITDRENTHAPLVRAICESGTVPPSVGMQLAEFAAIYITRTKAARDIVTRAIQAAWAKCCDAFADPDISRRELGRAFDEQPSKLIKHARRAAGGRYLTGREIIAFRSALVGSTPRSLPAMRRLSSSLDERGPRQKAHQNALRSLVLGEPSRRVESYRQYSWSAVRVATGSLILGDVGPLTFEFDSGAFVFSGSGVRNIGGLVIPLAPSMALLGQAQGATLPALDTGTLNAASADWSVDMFVSAVASDNEECLRQRLGRCSSAAFDKQLQELETQFRTGQLGENG